jgi:long-chain acyl-CoA synthetase
VGVTLTLRRTAQVRARIPATIFRDRTHTWSELLDRISRVAGGLRKLGIGPGDRVAGLGLNNDRYIELFAATPWAGGVMVPLNSRWSVPELADAIEDSTPKVLFVDDGMLETGRKLVAGASYPMHLVAMGESRPADLPHYEDLVSGNEPAADADRTGADLFGIFYTGGTTGRSKGVMLSHDNVIAGANAAYAEGYYREEAVYLISGGLFHASGSWPFVGLMGSGGQGVIMPSFEPGSALELIEKHRINEALLVPTMIQMMLDHPNFATADISSLRRIIYGAAPITEALLDRALKALPNVTFIQAYGQTELSPLACTLHHEHLLGEARARGRHRAAGRATYGMEIEIVDAEDRPVPRGTVGEIIARGANMMLGYWQRPEETAKAMRGGWMHTGDGGWMDEDGFVYVVDRVKDMIISGGENVYSVEVENAIARHPAVSQCAVVGIPHPQWGEQVHAFVVVRQGMTVTADEIIAHTRTLIAGYKIPRSVDVRDEALPLSPAGKILKRELRKPYWEGKDRAVN